MKNFSLETKHPSVAETPIKNNKMKKVNTWFNHEPTKGEVNNMPSLTIPDQTMTMREIMQRFASGQQILGNNTEPQYDDLESPYSGINLKTLDISERYDLAEEVQREYEELQEEIKNKRITTQKEQIRKELMESIKKEATENQ